MGSHFMWQKYRFLHGKCWRSTYTHEFVCTKPISKAFWAIEFCENKWVHTAKAMGIASVFHEWKSAILHANSTRKTRVKKYKENYMRKYTQIFLIACKTLHAHCYNLCVFGLLEFLRCWLSERSCTCAGGFVSKNQTFKACSNVSILCYLG